MHLSGHDCLFLLGLLLRSCLAFTNDATERLFPQSSASSPGEPQTRESLNRARSGGRVPGGGAHDTSDKGQIGCRELRSTKYISDGHCTSIHPIKELVCAGECLPAQLLPNWIGGTHGSRQWGKRSGGGGGQDWRCVNDKTRTQRIRLQCQDGSTRTYKITVVTSCKCKRYSRHHNESGSKFEEGAVSSPQLHKSKSKRKQGKKMVDNWQDIEP